MHESVRDWASAGAWDEKPSDFKSAGAEIFSYDGWLGSKTR